MPLREPFRTAHGVQSHRDVLLVRALGGDAEGWGECVAGSEPLYSEEYVEGAHDVMRRHLLPRLMGHELRAADVSRLMGPIRGHRMAKAALEAAVLDAELRAMGTSLSEWLGVTRRSVPGGVAVGLHASVASLLDAVDGFVSAGYARVKLKIEPGNDVEIVRAVRERHPGLALQVDANGAYSRQDEARLRALDEFELLLIEQPLAEDDLLGHAELARSLRTPVCLDESIISLRSAEHAIELGACSVINVKPGRVGGLLEAVRIHDLCLARGVAAWVGGMLETGIGRALNVALAALPGFTLPGDLSASGRYFERDITRPFVLDTGQLPIPDGPGIGVTPEAEALADMTTAVELIRP